MCNHAVVGADRQALHVPATHNGFVTFGFGEAAVQAHALNQAGHLGHGRNVADEHAAGCERLRHGIEALPGCEHVEHDAVDAAGLFNLRQGVLQVADAQLPRRVGATEHGFNVAAGDVCELFTPFEGVHATVVADCTQQRDGQCAGTDAGLDDACAGEDVCLDDDLGGVLGVDDGCTARHGEHEVLVEGAQRLVEDAVSVGDDGAFGCADEVVVLEEALVGVVFAAFGEGDGGDAAAFVSDLDALAGAEGAAAVDCAGRGVGAAAHGVVLLGFGSVCAVRRRGELWTEKILFYFSGVCKSAVAHYPAGVITGKLVSCAVSRRCGRKRAHHVQAQKSAGRQPRLSHRSAAPALQRFVGCYP